MKSRAKGLEITVNFNIGVKAGSMELRNERFENDKPRKNDEAYKDLDASCSFNIKFSADEYEDDIDLKELSETLNTLISKSVSEVKEQVKEQKITTEQESTKETVVEAAKETPKKESRTVTDSSEEPYSDDIDGDEIANGMC